MLVFSLFVALIICVPGVAQTPVDGHRITITYGGDVSIRFPNYDLHLVGAAARPFGINPLRSNSAPLVFRNNEGMYWDGSSGFINPNYPYDLLVKNRFAMVPINQSPPNPLASTKSTIPQQQQLPIAGAIREQAVTYRPEPGGDAILKMHEPDGYGMLKMSEPTVTVPINSWLKPAQLGGPEHLSRRPTATIIVRPYDPSSKSPPQHGTLGTFQR